MKGIMIQGTASDVGKSLIVTALCRLFVNKGWNITPFKSQNMSNNSYVTINREEIGRAQGIQAEAAKVEASVSMNPILLKPRSKQDSEVVLLGKVLNTMSGQGYRHDFYERGLEVIQSSLEHLEHLYDTVIIEGAGSPVEINLKEREIVNMKVAEIANVPVVLVADIDRGGVFASIIGTLELLSPAERSRVQGLIINKFRGDKDMFIDGIEWLERKTGIPLLGVIPYLDQHGIDGEDSLSLKNHKTSKSTDIDIAAVQLPYISNYSDLDPFLYEDDVAIRWIEHPSELGNPDALIIPGTKSTIEDLQHLKELEFDVKIKEYIGEGGFVVGICGGYQMLGERIIDSAGIDSGKINHQIKGIGAIPAETTFQSHKDTVRIKGSLNPRIPFDCEQELKGYEIHLGKTILHKDTHYFLEIDQSGKDGYCSHDGKVIGTYVHHLFHNDVWRNQWLNQIREQKGMNTKSTIHASDLKEERYDHLAAQLEKHLNWEKFVSIINDWEHHKCTT